MLAAETSAAGADLTEISKTGSHFGAQEGRSKLEGLEAAADVELVSIHDVNA